VTGVKIDGSEIEECGEEEDGYAEESVDVKHK